MDPSVNNIGYLLHHLAASLARQTEQLLMHHLGLGFSQFKILMVLQKDSGAQQKQLAERLGQTEASISRQMKGLERAKLLSVKVNPDNRREHITELTARGVQMVEDAREILNQHYQPLFESLGQRDLDRLLEILTKMHRYVCQPGKAGSCDLGK